MDDWFCIYCHASNPAPLPPPGTARPCCDVPMYAPVEMTQTVAELAELSRTSDASYLLHIIDGAAYIVNGTDYAICDVRRLSPTDKLVLGRRLVVPGKDKACSS